VAVFVIFESVIDRDSCHPDVNAGTSASRPHHAFCLHPQFVDYDGKRLLIIRCDPAKSPAYVKEGNAEYFYVRTGATTSDVPASQIHAFVEQRFSN
jgi:hypothetical protein